MAMVEVKVGRFDGKLTAVAVTEGDNVSKAFAKAGVDILASDKIVDLDNQSYDESDECIDGETYLLVKNLKNGQ